MCAGIVLAKEGGALGKMMPVFNIFAGGPLGSGRQWCSWIHRCFGCLLCTQSCHIYWKVSPNGLCLSHDILCVPPVLLPGGKAAHPH